MNQIFASVQQQAQNSSPSAESYQVTNSDIVSVFSFDESLKHALPGRIEAAFVECLAGNEASRNFYEDGACVPADAWAPLSKNEAATWLSSASRFDPISNVGIAEIDRYLVRPIIADLVSQDKSDPFQLFDVSAQKYKELTAC
jgi:hypothetical protein